MDDMVKLDVGGCLYTTSRSTLTRYPRSMLAAMFSGELDPSVRDANGAYVLDRDGPILRHVLNFLRQGKLILPEDFKEWDLLASEADFYQIEALVEAVKAEKNRRDATRTVNVGGYKYTMNLSTLTRYPDSMLAAMFISELDPSVCDANGAYVLDRDGPIFRHVLNFLRQGKLILPEDFKEWELLATEADFYQVEALVEAVKAEKYRRVIPEEEMEYVDFIELTACVNVKYTCRGDWEIISNLMAIREFFQEHQYKTFDGTLNLPCPHHNECNVHDAFETRKHFIFHGIFSLGFRLRERTYTLNAAGVKEFRWTFCRPTPKP